MPGVTPYISFNSSFDHSPNTSGNGQLVGLSSLLAGSTTMNTQDPLQFGTDDFNALPAGGNAGAAVRLLFPTKEDTTFVDPPGQLVLTDFDYSSAIPAGEKIKGIELSFAPVHLKIDNFNTPAVLNTGIANNSRFSFTIQTHQSVTTNLFNTVDITGDTATFTQTDQAGALAIPGTTGDALLNPQVYRFTMGGPTDLLGFDTFIASINSAGSTDPANYSALGQNISVIIHYDVSDSNADINLTTFGKIAGAYAPDNLLGSTPAIRFYYDRPHSKVHILGNKVHILGNKKIRVS